MNIRQLFCRHRWQDVTTPWNHLTVTHLRCMKCSKGVSAFVQKYKRKSQGRYKEEV